MNNEPFLILFRSIFHIMITNKTASFAKCCSLKDLFFALAPDGLAGSADGFDKLILFLHHCRYKLIHVEFAMKWKKFQ